VWATGGLELDEISIRCASNAEVDGRLADVYTKRLENASEFAPNAAPFRQITGACWMTHPLTPVVIATPPHAAAEQFAVPALDAANTCITKRRWRIHSIRPEEICARGVCPG